MTEIIEPQIDVDLDPKLEAFDREVKALIKQSRETIQARYKTAMELGVERPELVCLNTYLNFYHKTNPSEHTRYFVSLYQKKRRGILLSLDDDSWLRHGAVVQFGEGIKMTKEKEERFKQIRLPLSDIFAIALDLQEKAKKALEGIDEKFVTQDKDLVRPNILLLHLLRIFYHLEIEDGKDQKDLLKIINHIETQLGMEKKTGNTTVAVSTAPAAGGLSGLFTMATSMMERMGIKIPPGMVKPPSEAQITDAITKVFNDETTQSTIRNITSTLQNGTDLNSTFQEVVKTMTDPKTIEALQSTLGASLRGSLGATGGPAPSPQ